MQQSSRLRTTPFNRPKSDSSEPHRSFILSMEGTVTELEYFNGVKKHKEEIRIPAIVDIVPLEKVDTKSDPKHVVELMDEAIRRPEYIKHDHDVYCIVIDNDRRKNLDEVIHMCRDMGRDYTLFLSSPCFEFWLLLHRANCEQIDSYEPDKILENKRVSSKHTYISKILSQLTHSGPKKIDFAKDYLPHIDVAVQRAGAYAAEIKSLTTQLGTNIGQLIEKMRENIT